jgi:PAS domain S-box-containing protein
VTSTDPVDRTTEPNHGPPLELPDRRAAASRLAASAPRTALDRLARLTARLLGTGYAQVSLVVDDQMVAGLHGMDLPDEARRGPAVESLCAVTAAQGEPLVVANARVDDRVNELPPVTSGVVGAYLGAPLRSAGGHVVGAVCAYDGSPRRWSSEEVSLLSELAGSVVAELELAAISADLAASTARLELGSAAAGIGSYDWDLRTGRLHWDERLMRPFGYDAATFPAEFEGVLTRVHDDDRARLEDAVRAALDSCGELTEEYRVVLPDGTQRWVTARGRVLPDAGGEPLRMLGAAFDSTEVRDEQQRVARVLESMANAFYSLDHAWTITYVNGAAERMLGRGREELVGANLWEAFPAAAGTTFEDGYRRAVESGEAVSFEACYPPLDSWFEVWAWPSPDGGLAVYFNNINARRQAEAQRQEALQAAESANARLQTIADASAALTGTLDARRVLEVLSDVIVPDLAAWLFVALRGELVPALGGHLERADGVGEVAIVHVAHPVLATGGASTLPIDVPLSLDDPHGVGRVISTGRPEWLTEVDDEVLATFVSEEVPLARLQALELGSAFTVPLSSGGRVLGAVTVAEPAGAALDRRLLEDLGIRAGTALDNAFLYGATRQAGLTLQRSLLPRSLPSVDGVEIATRYLPGVRTLEVGGDFYLAQALPDERLLLVMGDVMGRGIRAAAEMGQLRSVIASLAYDGDPPAEVLGRLAPRVERLLDLEMATALLGLYDPATRRLQLASAGHPPPLLAPLSGAPHYLAVQPGPPLGSGVADHPPFEVELPAGATLVLYTDGLVETREEPLDVGMERLRQAVREVRLPPDLVCDHVLRELGRDRGTDDDVAMVVMSHRADPG